MKFSNTRNSETNKQFTDLKEEEKTCSGFNPRRDKDGRNSKSKAIKIEIVWRRAESAVRIGNSSRGGRDVIEETAMLVVSDQEEDFVPLWTGSQSFIDLFDEFLAF